MNITKTVQPHQFKIPIINPIPDRSDRHIHDIRDKTLQIGIMENGHNAYLVELPDLKSLLRSSRYLMDEVTGQFYAVFGNSYQCMCTIPRLLHTWEPGKLIDELAATRCAFGCMGPTEPTPAMQISQPHLADPVSTAYNEEIIPDLTTQEPLPRTTLPAIIIQPGQTNQMLDKGRMVRGTL